MFRVHVIIVRRSKLYYTASGNTYRCDDTRGHRSSTGCARNM